MTAAAKQADGESGRIGGAIPWGAYVWYPVLRFLQIITMGFLYHVRWRGAHRIPREGAFVLAPNHQSWLDPPLLGVPVRQRMFRYMANAKYFPVPVVGSILRGSGVIPIDLKARLDRRAYAACLQTLRAGEGLVVFPEGTRSHDGRLGKLNTGPARMALQTGAALVPVAITGAYDVWPRSRKAPRLRGNIMLKFYPPIPVALCESPQEISPRAEQLTQQIENVLRTRINAYYRWLKRHG